MKTLRDPATQREIQSRLAQLCPTDQPQWGRMSAHQMICHLRDSYALALGEKTARPATGLVQRTVFKWLALWLPIPWAKGFPTRPEVEQGKGGSKPVEFTTDQTALNQVLTRFCALQQPTAPHPIFGPMQHREWARWGYLHADHHLRQFGR